MFSLQLIYSNLKVKNSSGEKNIFRDFLRDALEAGDDAQLVI